MQPKRHLDRTDDDHGYGYGYGLGNGYGYGSGLAPDDGARHAGGHRGKGPSNFQRSDERIKEDVCEVLTDHDLIDASGIEVTVVNGEVVLAGHVPDRFTKRMAETCVEHLSGVKDVLNQLRIQGEGSDPRRVRRG